MGFFRKVFGAGKPGPSRESFAPPSFPYAGEIRLLHQDYDRLSTGWWGVSVASPEEWGAKIREMEEGIRSHFGSFATQAGQVVPRWTEETWARVRQRLVVESR